jgi:hypothetical protein
MKWVNKKVNLHHLASGGEGYPAVTKWETGIKRGSANPLGNTKWKDSYTITRGKANTLL